MPVGVAWVVAVAAVSGRPVGVVERQLWRGGRLPFFVGGCHGAAGASVEKRRLSELLSQSRLGGGTPALKGGCRGRCVGLTLSNLKGSEVEGNAVPVIIFWFGACAWRRDSFASFAVPRRAGVAGREGSGGARDTAADKASKTMPSHFP